MRCLRSLSWAALALVWPFGAAAQGLFGVFPNAITFTVAADQPVAASQTITVNSGTAPFEWAAATGAPNFVTVSPSSGVGITTMTVSLNPNVVPYLVPGRYILTLEFDSTDPAQPGGAIAAVTLVIQPLPPPTPVITSVVNSASQQPILSRGELVTIYGTNLGTGPVVPAGSYSVPSGGTMATFGRQPLGFDPLSNTLPPGNTTTVTFNRLPAPLLYISPTQINAVVPYATQPDASGSVPVVVAHDAQTSAAFSVAIAVTAPAIFTIAPNGRGQGAIQNVDSQTGAIKPNSVSNPAPKGSTIVLYGTGTGGWSQTPPDGAIITDVFSPPYYRVSASLTIGGQPAKILYAGAAPYQVSGVLQVNAVVPDGISSGPQPVVLTIGQSGNSQQGVTLAVQ